MLRYAENGLSIFLGGLSYQNHSQGYGVVLFRTVIVRVENIWESHLSAMTFEEIATSFSNYHAEM